MNFFTMTPNFKHFFFRGGGGGGGRRGAGVGEFCFKKSKSK